MFTKFVLPIVALVMLVFAVVHVTEAAEKPEPASRPIIEPPHNPFPQTVAGAGLVEPQTETF